MIDIYNYRYQIYGLTVAINRKILNLQPIRKTGSSDVTVDLGAGFDTIDLTPQTGWRRQYPLDAAALNGFEVWETPTTYRLRYYRSAIDMVEFEIDRAGTQICVRRTKTIPETDVVSFLLGSVLGCALRLRDKVCLHGSVIVRNGVAFILVGRKGVGKSITATEFVRRGDLLASDDVAVISDVNSTFWVESGYPKLRLSIPALQSFGVSVDTLTPVLSAGNKRYLPLLDSSSGKYHGKSSPVAAIYLLEPRQSSDVALSIDPLSQPEALLRVATHSYAAYMMDQAAKRREFLFLGKLVKHVRIRAVTRPHDLSRLSDIGRLILHDFDTLNNG